MTHDGLRIGTIPVEEFSSFARRNATSPEIGPVKTGLEDRVDRGPGAKRNLMGLWGCDRLCAVACLQIFRSRLAEAEDVVKLDSVIVGQALRRRGLARLLVAQSLRDLVADGTREVAQIYAHSVHPATVRLLGRLTFSDPPITGAPISSLSVDARTRDEFIRTCEDHIRQQVAQMRLQCEFCRKRNRRARPWCLPAGEKAGE